MTINRLELVTEGTFDAAHHIPKYSGICARTHGHTFKYSLYCEGVVNDEGMVVDFNIFKELDHINLNDKIKVPTAENVCLYLVNKILNYNSSIRIFSLKIYENPLSNEYVEFSNA